MISYGSITPALSLDHDSLSRVQYQMAGDLLYLQVCHPHTLKLEKFPTKVVPYPLYMSEFRDSASDGRT